MPTQTPCRILLLASISLLVAAALPPAAPVRLTPERIGELTAPSEALAPGRYNVAISDIGKARLNAPEGAATLESIREFRFPIAFDPPAQIADKPFITPTTPTQFETVNTGWTVKVTAKRREKLVEVYGIANFTEAEMVRGGYGALSGPIHSKAGELISPNRIEQPRFQTTTTRFHVFALPGEACEIQLFRGAKAQKHTFVLTED